MVRKKRSPSSKKVFATAGQVSPDELAERMGKLRERLKAAKLDALLVTNPVNVRYLSGFTGDDSYLLVTRRSLQLLTDFRYVEEAAESAPHARTIERKKTPLMKLAARAVRRARVGVLGFETSCPVAEHRALQRARDGFRLRAAGGLVEKLRLHKSPAEVRQIERALRAGEAAYSRIVESLGGARFGSPGRGRRGTRAPSPSELALAAWLRYEMTADGQAQDQAFNIIVAFGARASLPHARPSTRRLRPRDLVLIDWGAVCHFYHADLTRTFFVGRIPPKLGKVWEIVRAAQSEALRRVEPGVKLADLDAAARGVIEKAGYGKAFGHSLGHGLGMEIHESPRLAATSKAVAEPGMVFTIEPGIYLPGVGGVRIEDNVLVTPTGCRVLSRLPVEKELGTRG